MIAACGGDGASPGRERAGSLREAAERAGLDDEVADVLAGAAAGIDGTFRVVYEVDGSTVTVTQRPPQRRIDVVAADGAEDATITTGGTTHACTKPPGGTWRCEELGAAPPQGVIDDRVIDELVAALTGAAESYEIFVEEVDVAGTAARCVVTSRRASAPANASIGDRGRLCVAASGAVVLVERPAGTLRAVEHTTDVGDDAFELPT